MIGSTSSVLTWNEARIEGEVGHPTSLGWYVVSRAEMDKQPDEVSGMFDGVARHYDRTNAIMSVGNAQLWRAATVRAVDPQPGERILDVAAGTGTSSAALARTRRHASSRSTSRRA